MPPVKPAVCGVNGAGRARGDQQRQERDKDGARPRDGGAFFIVHGVLNFSPACISFVLCFRGRRETVQGSFVF